MTASELYRKLLYRGHTELSTLLEESPVNYSLYQFLREVKPPHQINISMTNILNEAYYLCIRASRDLTPGDHFYERYVAEEKAWTGSKMATELIFCIAIIILKMQKKLSPSLDCLVKSMISCYGTGVFEKEINDFLHLHKEKGEEWDSDFTPQPVPVGELPRYRDAEPKSLIDALVYGDKRKGNPWRVVTRNYSQTYILDFLRCYHTIDDQRTLLERIQESASTEERLAMEGFYTETRELIEMGEYLPRMIQKINPSNDRSSELAIAYQQIELLKCQIDDLKQQYTTRLSEQSAEFDRRLARMEVQYKSELAANKAEQSIIAQDNISTQPSFTIAEMVDHAKSQCSRENADIVISMLYRLSAKHGFTNEATLGLIDGIIPVIEQRNPLHQTIDIPSVGQLNLNPQTVNNNHQPE